MLAGFRFIWRCETILGAMLFDFAAALFGSVNALLPIYARDILEIGAWGAGVLRSAPALGALIAAAVLSRFPMQRAGGFWLFAGFAVTGVAEHRVRPVAQPVIISIVALMAIGIGDMVSTVIRQTLIQVTTPDEMRGRVLAVNSLFYGTASQLGAFRAGVHGGVDRRGRIGRGRRRARCSRRWRCGPGCSRRCGASTVPTMVQPYRDDEGARWPEPRRMDETASTEPPIADLPIDPSTPLFSIRPFALLFTTRSPPTPPTRCWRSRSASRSTSSPTARSISA